MLTESGLPCALTRTSSSVTPCQPRRWVFWGLVGLGLCKYAASLLGATYSSALGGDGGGVTGVGSTRDGTGGVSCTGATGTGETGGVGSGITPGGGMGRGGGVPTVGGAGLTTGFGGITLGGSTFGESGSFTISIGRGSSGRGPAAPRGKSPRRQAGRAALGRRRTPACAGPVAAIPPSVPSGRRRPA